MYLRAIRSVLKAVLTKYSPTRNPFLSSGDSSPDSRVYHSEPPPSPPTSSPCTPSLTSSFLQGTACFSVPWHITLFSVSGLCSCCLPWLKGPSSFPHTLTLILRLNSRQPPWTRRLGQSGFHGSPSPASLGSVLTPPYGIEISRGVLSWDSCLFSPPQRSSQDRCSVNVHLN